LEVSDHALAAHSSSSSPPGINLSGSGHTGGSGQSHNHHSGHIADNNNCDSSTFCDHSQCDKERMLRHTKRHLGIARREECHVRYIRIVTLSFILLSAVSVSFLVYGFAKEFDHEVFMGKYESYAKSIQKDVVWKTKYSMALMKQLSASVTSEIVATDQSPPFVTLPRFEVMGGFTDGLGGIMMTSFVPIVHDSDLPAWEEYSVEHQGWLEESAKLRAIYGDMYDDPLHDGTDRHDGEIDTLSVSRDDDDDHFAPYTASGEALSRLSNETSTTAPTSFDARNGKIKIDDSETEADRSISRISETVWFWNEGERVPLQRSNRNDGLIAPLWQIAPAEASAVNVDMFSDATFSRLFEVMIDTDYQTVRSAGGPITDLFDFMVPADEEFRKMEPHACLLEPIFSDFTGKEEAVAKNLSPTGLVLGLIEYRHLFENILPVATRGEGLRAKNGDEPVEHTIYAILDGKGDCGPDLTYLIDGPEATFVGYGSEYHEPSMARYRWGFDIDFYDTVTEDICVRTLTLYPTEAFIDAFDSNTAWLYTGLVALAFAVTSFCFLIYERLVTKREKTKNAALEVVASLFPSGVQDRVLEGVQEGHHGTPEKGNVIASFFPATTVMFADIAGFTAWSSTRDPEQVFRLLETVYGAMDEIALRRGVFKVETVGDCYVAVCGLPEPMDDHAVAMTRFAKGCQLRMASLSRQLEVALGPDTADLSFRIGLHSGPVTGGVLRGQNARFQLFGDTMNQASRMESTGIRDRIQMSETTAKLLTEAGKAKWIEKRTEKVDVKGKGLQQTYFVKESTSGTALTRSVASASSGEHTLPLSSSSKESSPRKAKRPSMESIVSTAAEQEALERYLPNKTQRLVTWNTEVLLRRVRSIVYQREHSSSLDHGGSYHTELSPKVVEQLKRHVQHISSMYRDNAFHSYEHASHVTMSMEKMLSNVNSNGPDSSFSADSSTEFSFNRYTSDLTNDPLAQFAVVYSALIHDVDHTGANNAQLIKEKSWLAVQYNGKSPAENHSIDLAWSTLMLPDYRDLLDCLCPSTRETERLKQLITDAVLATDIFDEDLIQNRNTRWQQVFGPGPVTDPENVDNLRVMVVLDHLIQASDVAHTMQHWHVYIKWNERLFWEMSDAYRRGRLGKDPAEFWYAGELGFFDKYVIPLAKKIRECGVFGVSCYEFLNYAETNRTEWETKGKDLVREYVQRYRDAHPKAAAEDRSGGAGVIDRQSGGGFVQRRTPYPRSRTMSHCIAMSEHDSDNYEPRRPPTRTKSLPMPPEDPPQKPPRNPAA